jgi:hypothetical protein
MDIVDKVGIYYVYTQYFEENRKMVCILLSIYFKKCLCI